MVRACQNTLKSKSPGKGGWLDELFNAAQVSNAGSVGQKSSGRLTTIGSGVLRTTTQRKGIAWEGLISW